MADATSLPSPLVDLAEAARLLGLSKSSMEKLCAEAAWKRGDIPVPVFVGRGSGSTDRYGRRGGVRRWRVADVEAFVLSHRADAS